MLIYHHVKNILPVGIQMIVVVDDIIMIVNQTSLFYHYNINKIIYYTQCTYPTLSKMRQSLLFFTFLLLVTIRSQQFLLLLWSHCIISTISFCFFHITIGRQMRIGQWQFLGRTANRLWITALVVLCCACI